MIILTIDHPYQGTVTINLPDDAEIKVTKVSVSFIGKEQTLQTWVIDKHTTIKITHL